MAKEHKISKKELLKQTPDHNKKLSDELTNRFQYCMKAETRDPNVKYLNEPFLSEYGIDDFPRIKKYLDIHFEIKPEVCPELPQLVTDWHKTNGYETDKNGKPWNPVLRKAHAYKYLMEHRTGKPGGHLRSGG